QTQRLFGCRRAELIGQQVEMFLPGLVRPHHLADLRVDTDATCTIAPSKGQDVRGRRKDGSEFAGEVSLSPIDGHDGLIAAIRDVTDRNAAERVAAQTAIVADIKVARAMQEAANVLASDDAMIAKSLDGVITHWNHGAEGMYGYVAEEVIGKNIS